MELGIIPILTITICNFVVLLLPIKLILPYGGLILFNPVSSQTEACEKVSRVGQWFFLGTMISSTTFSWLVIVQLHYCRKCNGTANQAPY